MFTVDEKEENLNREFKPMKKKVILELKNTIFEIEKSVGEFYSWLNTVKHHISELEEMSRKYPTKVREREKKMKRTEHKRHAGIR